MGIAGGTATAAARQTGHEVSFILTAVLMGFLVIFIAYGTRNRWGTRWQIYGPTILVSIAYPLIIADPLRHLLVDKNVWTDDSASMYRSDCDSETIRCLSVTGVFFTIIFTYVGFILLAWGTLWNANIIDKLKAVREKWRELRAQSRATDDDRGEYQTTV